jgi:hypothetical protein
MYESEHHEMHLEATYPSGAEQWFCPACGRRFVMHWPPAYSMTVIDQGDQYVRHSGSKGGLRLGPTQVMEAEETPLTDELLSPQIPSSHEAEETEATPLTDELRPWLKWMQDAGLYDERDEAA